MPFGDRTGPQGLGPRTGRGAGCGSQRSRMYRGWWYGYACERFF